MPGVPMPRRKCCRGCTKPLNCGALPSTLNFSVASDCPFYDGWAGNLSQDGCTWSNTAGEQGGACDFADYMVFALVVTDCCDTTRLQLTGECGNEFLDQEPEGGGYAPVTCVDDPFEMVFTFDFIMNGSEAPGSCECCDNETIFTITITITE